MMQAMEPQGRERSIHEWATLTLHQRDVLKGLAARPDGITVWRGLETITHVQLREFGLIDMQSIGPLAGGRYRWRLAVTADGRRLVDHAGAR